ncbi:MAG: InlB B-repeat-containing protein [Bacilli bacterium]
MNLDKKKIIIGGISVVVLIGVIVLFNQFKTLTVIFDAQGGTSTKSEEVRVNNEVSKPKDPVMVGYSFDGWYINDSLFTFDTKITKDITLKAKWIKITKEN